MKTIKNLKDVSTLEVGDKVIFGDLEYAVWKRCANAYFLSFRNGCNNEIFRKLNLNKRDFIEKLGIEAQCGFDFPEVKSLEALTAIVSALFKEYEQQHKLPKTWEEFCKRNKIREGESFIDCYEQDVIEVDLVDIGIDRDPQMHKNLCISVQEAQAFLAFKQLRQLRKAYVNDWEPDYKHQYYGIIYNIHGLDILPYTLVHKSMSFPTHELAEQFLNNFKDLLEIAKSLM